MLNRIRPYPYRLWGWHPSVALVTNWVMLAIVFSRFSGVRLPISLLVLVAGALALFPYAVGFAGRLLGLGRTGLAALYGVFVAGSIILMTHIEGGYKLSWLPVATFVGITSGILSFVMDRGSGVTRS